MQHPNAFKTAIAARQRQIGLWLSMADSVAAEICATAGFDWFLIDGEHAPNDLRTILSQMQTLAAFGVEPVVRPPIGEAWLIKQLLDAGARSLLVPMVDTAEQARELVSMTRYPPHGIRGVGARMARASGYGSRSDYIAKAKDEMCLLVQVETASALGQIEAIAAVEGVDGIFVGPSDLAASMGHPGNPAHPEVRAAVEDALRRIAAAGKPSGIVSFNADDTQRFIDLGTMFVAVGADAAILADGTRALVKRFKHASQ
ncbi:aldolase/citrate lyase family protein [Paraburkholderia sp. ZP32-5]|uniref:aldolase/citrate lyase family protein n=1 Tax=Paraburkholderia sp. ZP32-5 TaxID=2883245 RepID=UPI001F47AA3D|nr:aldolase/citrate lyase family protein [Paraburkholderia sp. ZP32-5]